MGELFNSENRQRMKEEEGQRRETSCAFERAERSKGGQLGLVLEELE